MVIFGNMTIPPNFTITNRIVSLLTKIEANKISINSHTIPEKIISNLTHLSLLKSSVYSAQIEGNTLTPEDFENRTQEKGNQYEQQEIENIIVALTTLREKKILNFLMFI